MREGMKVIFIVGSFDQNAFEMARRCKEVLAKNLVGVCSLYDLAVGLDAESEYFKHLCGIFLRTTASAILALPEWEESEVAKSMVVYAKKYNLDIFYPKTPSIEDNEMFKIVRWGRAPWLMTLKK